MVTKLRHKSRLLVAATLAGLAATVAVAGCDRGWRQTPYPQSAMASRYQGDPTQARQVAVAPGDTVYRLSRRLGVPTRAIIVANNLSPPFVLQPGQVLTLPPQQVHQVAPSETLYALSRRYGPSVPAIANANGLAPPYVIRAGEWLVIPAETVPAMPAAPTPQTAMATPAPVYTPPVTSRPVTSAPVYTPPVTSRPVTSAPVYTPPVTSAPTRPPTPLLAPSTSTRPAPLPAISAPAQAPIPPAPLPQAPAPAAEPPPPPPMPTAAVARDAVPVPAPPPRAGSRFIWPVDGEIIAAFGPDHDGLHNDGIDIAVPDGTPIRAADNGVVVYAGNEIVGFGNLVLIRHAENWTTAYANASRIDVQRGQVVERGQVVARSGRTGSASQPMLHFEVRKGTVPVDPRPHLSRPASS